MLSTNIIYKSIENKLKDAYNINIGLITNNDKVFVLIPSNVMKEECSSVFDLIYEVSEELEITKSEVAKYIDYKTEESYDFSNTDIKWYN